MAKDDHSYIMPKPLYFAILCILCALTSGGLLAGIGPFQLALVKEDYFSDISETTSVYTGAFQIMTVMTCMSGLSLFALGPRLVAMTGLSFAALGNMLVATVSKDDPSRAAILLVGLGLLGGGGNALWISCFPSCCIFQSSGYVATATAALSGMWNVSGLVYMILYKVSVSDFFEYSAYWNGVAFLCCFLIFPDNNDSPVINFEISTNHTSLVDEQTSRHSDGGGIKHRNNDMGDDSCTHVVTFNSVVLNVENTNPLIDGTTGDDVGIIDSSGGVGGGERKEEFGQFQTPLLTSTCGATGVLSGRGDSINNSSSIENKSSSYQNNMISRGQINSSDINESETRTQSSVRKVPGSGNQYEEVGLPHDDDERDQEHTTSVSTWEPKVRSPLELAYDIQRASVAVVQTFNHLASMLTSTSSNSCGKGDKAPQSNLLKDEQGRMFQSLDEIEPTHINNNQLDATDVNANNIDNANYSQSRAKSPKTSFSLSNEEEGSHKVVRSMEENVASSLSEDASDTSLHTNNIHNESGDIATDEDLGTDDEKSGFDMNLMEIITDRRFQWFVLTFSFVATFTVVLYGYIATMAESVGESDSDDENKQSVNTFTGVWFPITGAFNAVLSPLFGIFVDHKLAAGMGLSSPLSWLLIATQLCAAAAFLPDLIGCPPVYHLLSSLFSSHDNSNDDSEEGDDDSSDSIQRRKWQLYSLYVVLFMQVVVQAALYPLQFQYLEHRFKSNVFGSLIAVETAAQAVIGLLAYPILSPNPFRDKNYRWPILVALAPTLFCWNSPWLEKLAWEKDKKKQQKLERN